MVENFTIYEFRPLHFTLERIGPFQDQIYEVDFSDKELRACNFFLLVSKNGFGKTTILETMGALLGLLDQQNPTGFGQEDLDRHQGRAQLDLFLRVYHEGRNKNIIFSIIAGAPGDDFFMKTWGDGDLEKHNADDGWHTVSYQCRKPGLIDKVSTGSELVKDLLAVMRFGHGRTPTDFLESGYYLPTTLSFSAYRDIPPIRQNNYNGQGRDADNQSKQSISQPKHWGYQSYHAFAPHDQQWHGSLDKLLVWLKWLDDGRFEKARDLINQHVFRGSEKILKDVRRDPPEAIIKCGSGSHRLDRLSSGEKSMIHLFLRIGAHMTSNTILLIDEIEAHLHIRWQHRLFKALKSLVRDNPGVTLIATTHSSELLHTFVNSMNIVEEGLVKGGDLIELDMR